MPRQRQAHSACTRFRLGLRPPRPPLLTGKQSHMQPHAAFVSMATALVHSNLIERRPATFSSAWSLRKPMRREALPAASRRSRCSACGRGRFGRSSSIPTKDPRTMADLPRPYRQRDCCRARANDECIRRCPVSPESRSERTILVPAAGSLGALAVVRSLARAGYAFFRRHRRRALSLCDPGTDVRESSTRR